MLRVVLLDASGSMEPAWDTAWSIVFNNVQKSSFILLAFKARYVDNIPQQCVHQPANAVIYDLGCALASRGVTRLRRKPSPGDVGLRFSTRTPLNDAIYFAIQRLEQRNVPYEIIVVSDNRDTASYWRLGDVKLAKQSARHLRRIVLHCVGSCLQKYLDPYDEVYVHASQPTLRPSPFL